jgi:alpha-glucosidase (family GH31 glycosyl hydrolase)
MPPYHALGFYQGSNAYTNTTQLTDVLANYTKIGVPLEGLILDNYNWE